VRRDEKARGDGTRKEEGGRDERELGRVFRDPARLQRVVPRRSILEGDVYMRIERESASKGLAEESDLS